jgi:hypothetical protein
MPNEYTVYKGEYIINYSIQTLNFFTKFFFYILQFYIFFINGLSVPNIFHDQHATTTLLSHFLLLSIQLVFCFLSVPSIMLSFLSRNSFVSFNKFLSRTVNTQLNFFMSDSHCRHLFYYFVLHKKIHTYICTLPLPLLPPLKNIFLVNKKSRAPAV